jgi:hypothetical protein
MTNYMRHFFAMVAFITVGLMGVYGQDITLKQAEMRTLAGSAKESPAQFSVILSVSGVDNMKSVYIEFFSGNSASKVSMELKKVTEGNQHFILSSGARFPVSGDDIVFNIEAPRGHNSEMRQANITIDNQSGGKSNTITAKW